MDDLEMQIMADLNKVVENVTEWAEDGLREFLLHYVYDYGDMHKTEFEDGSRVGLQYHNDDRFKPHRYWGSGKGYATGQTLHSITYRPLFNMAVDEIGYEIFSDYQQMQTNGSTMLHSDGSSDNRADMFRLLNENISSMGDASDWWNNRTPFFDEYLDYLGNMNDSNSRIYKRFEYEMTKIGWKWRKES